MNFKTNRCFCKFSKSELKKSIKVVNDTSG